MGTQLFRFVEGLLQTDYSVSLLAKLRKTIFKQISHCPTFVYSSKSLVSAELLHVEPVNLIHMNVGTHQ